jgi:hypothetical protein
VPLVLCFFSQGYYHCPAVGALGREEQMSFFFSRSQSVHEYTAGVRPNKLPVLLTSHHHITHESWTHDLRRRFASLSPTDPPTSLIERCWWLLTVHGARGSAPIANSHLSLPLTLHSSAPRWARTGHPAT